MTELVNYKEFTFVACDICKHRTEGTTCKAFPDGIPFDYVSVNIPHIGIQRYQHGDFIFELCELKEDWDEELKAFHELYEEILSMPKNEKHEQISPELIRIKKCVEVIKYTIKKLKASEFTQDIYHVLKIIYFADRDHLYKYRDSIIFTKYLKLPYGPVPKLALNIIRFVRGDKLAISFDESIKKEFRVLKNHKVEILNDDIDFNYLSETDIECLNGATKKYGHLSFSGLKEESHDEIYKSIYGSNCEFTMFDMLKILDNNKEFADRCRL